VKFTLGSKEACYDLIFWLRKYKDSIHSQAKQISEEKKTILNLFDV